MLNEKYKTSERKVEEADHLLRLNTSLTKDLSSVPRVHNRQLVTPATSSPWGISLHLQEHKFTCVNACMPVCAHVHTHTGTHTKMHLTEQCNSK